MKKLLLATLMVIMLASPVLADAMFTNLVWADGYDPGFTDLPVQVELGDTVSFSYVFMATAGFPVVNGTIYLIEDANDDGQITSLDPKTPIFSEEHVVDVSGWLTYDTQNLVDNRLYVFQGEGYDTEVSPGVPGGQNNPVIDFLSFETYTDTIPNNAPYWDASFASDYYYILGDLGQWVVDLSSYGRDIDPGDLLSYSIDNSSTDGNIAACTLHYNSQLYCIFNGPGVTPVNVTVSDGEDSATTTVNIHVNEGELNISSFDCADTVTFGNMLQCTTVVNNHLGIPVSGSSVSVTANSITLGTCVTNVNGECSVYKTILPEDFSAQTYAASSVATKQYYRQDAATDSFTVVNNDMYFRSFTCTDNLEYGDTLTCTSEIRDATDNYVVGAQITVTDSIGTIGVCTTDAVGECTVSKVITLSEYDAQTYTATAAGVKAGFNDITATDSFVVSSGVFDSVALSCSPDPVYVGQQVTCVATVFDGGSAVGGVDVSVVSDTGVSIGACITDAVGECSVVYGVTSVFGVGQKTATGTFSKTGFASASASDAFTVVQRALGIVVFDCTDSVEFGAVLTCSVRVVDEASASVGGVAVSVVDGVGSVGVCTTDAVGECSVSKVITLSEYDAQTYTATATATKTDYLSDTATDAFTVTTMAFDTMDFECSPSNIYYGETLTCTTTLTDNNTPVSGASVSVTSDNGVSLGTCTTTSAGVCNVQKVILSSSFAVDEYTATSTATKSGYGSQSNVDDFQVIQHELAFEDFSCTDTASYGDTFLCEINVVDENDDVVQGASVSVVADNGASIGTCTTNILGDCSVSLIVTSSDFNPGAYEATASATKQYYLPVTASTNFDVELNSFDDAIHFDCIPYTVYYGETLTCTTTVLDGNAPISQANVIVESETGVLMGTCITNATGTCSVIETITQNEYSLGQQDATATVSKTDYEDGEADEKFVVAAHSLDIDYFDCSGTYEYGDTIQCPVHVVDENSADLGGASVSVQASNGVSFGTCITDNSGDCLFSKTMTSTDFNLGPYSVTATATKTLYGTDNATDGFVVQLQSMTVDSFNCTPNTLSNGEQLSCTMALLDGNSPISGATVNMVVGASNFGTCLTNNQGRCTVIQTINGYGVGTYTVDATATKQDYTTVTADDDFNVVLRSMVLDVVCSPNNAYVGDTLTCTATTTEGVNPLSGVQVQFDYGLGTCTTSTAGTCSVSSVVTIPPFSGGQNTINAQGSKQNYATENDAFSVTVNSHSLSITNFDCTDDVVLGDDVACSATVRDDNGQLLSGATVTLAGSLGTCTTTNGRCTATFDSTLIGAGATIVQATATRQYYESSTATDTVNVWASRYRIDDFEAYRDSSYTTLTQDYYRGDDVYIQFKVWDYTAQSYTTLGISSVTWDVNASGQLSLVRDGTSGDNVRYTATIPAAADTGDQYMGLATLLSAQLQDVVTLTTTNQFLNNPIVWTGLPNEFNFTDDGFGGVVPLTIDLKQYVQDIETDDSDVQFLITTGATVNDLGNNVVQFTTSQTSGVIPVVIRADDTDGSSIGDAFILVVNVSLDTPDAVIQYPADIIVDVNATFDGTSSSGAYGTSITNYTWIIDDTLGPVSLSGPTIDYAFTNEGYYNVSLTVTDTLGMSDTETVEVYVELGQVIAIIEGEGNAVQGKPETFDGSKSYSVQGYSIVNYDWTIYQENGNFIGAFSGPTITYAFAERERYIITLTATDARGATGTTKHTVLVGKPKKVYDFGPEDGLMIRSLSIEGIDYEKARLGDDLYIFAEVYNDAGEELNDVRMTYTIPEFGLRFQSSAVDLDEGERAGLFIKAFVPEYVEPGVYYPYISFAEGDIRRVKAGYLEVVE